MGTETYLLLLSPARSPLGQQAFLLRSTHPPASGLRRRSPAQTSLKTICEKIDLSKALCAAPSPGSKVLLPEVVAFPLSYSWGTHPLSTVRAPDSGVCHMVCPDT